ncbi:thiolase family protein [Rhodococcus sp. BE178]|uniref:thiolase family protein n=1 Tax=Rhodococcus sp. BE178 TaxID=2817737 RepID=UPI003D2491D4
MNASIYGVGTSMFGRQPHMSDVSLVQRAVLEAFEDAEIDRVDAVFAGTVFGVTGTIQRCLQTLGIVGVPVVTVENACATGSTALFEAVHAVESGRYEHVLCLGVETMTTHFNGPITPAYNDSEGVAGLAMPGIYGLAASRYGHLYDVELDDLALVAVKNRAHGSLNPRAQHGRQVTVEDVLGSRMVAEPLTLLQCCDISDAAAAAVVGPKRNSKRDISVLSTVLQSGNLWDHRSNHPWGFELMQSVAEEAWKKAGLGPGDMDLFEVHDAFTIGEVTATEALGLSPVGQGLELVKSGHTKLGGRQPVNPSGGLLSRGHALGATGLAQIAEAVWQLRDEAGARQVDGARTAAVETMGGGAAGIDGNGCVITILGG